MIKINQSLLLDARNTKHEVQVRSLISLFLLVLVELCLFAADSQLVNVLFEMLELFLSHLWLSLVLHFFILGLHWRISIL